MSRIDLLQSIETIQKMEEPLDNIQVLEQKMKNIELQDFIEKTDSYEKYI